MRTLFLASACLLMTAGVLAAGPLDELPTVTDHTSHRSSSHDPTGGNVDNVTSFAPGATHVLLDVDGPGKITHLWMTVSRFPGHETFLRDLVIRMTWDNAAVPSVDVPLGDFFTLGHGKWYKVKSAPVAVGANPVAMNCYWPMPFRKHARVEIVNNGRRSVRRLYYNLDYELGAQPADQGLFHAEFRRDAQRTSQARRENTHGRDNYVILETSGKGQYVGCALFIDAQPGGWWGEGDDMIFIDHSDKPVIIGTGSEDYFCNAWGYHEAFNYPYYGAPLLQKKPDDGSYTTVYRWHIPDPIRFSEHIKVTIETIFGKGIVNDYSSVAYWYQLEPIQSRQPLPFAEANHPRQMPQPKKPAHFGLHATQLEANLHKRGIKAKGITAGLSAGYHNGGWLRIELDQPTVELHIPVSEPGEYRVSVKPVNYLIDKSLTLQLGDNEPQTVVNRAIPEKDVGFVDLGTMQSKDNRLIVKISGDDVIGLDYFKVSRTGS